MKKILHTIYTCLLWMGFIGFALSGCKDDDLAKNNGDVVEGVPITVTMKLAGTPAADVTVDTRASDNDLSTLSNLTIYVFDGNGTYQQTVSTLDGFESLEIKGPTGTSDVTYEVKFETTSGTKKLLAVGNSTSSVWSEANNINVSTMNFEELKKHLANLNIPLNQDGEFSRPATITSDGQMMITGKNEGIQFDTNGTVVNWGESENNIAVKMKRIMAHVTFNITPPKDGNAKGTFIPTSYKVYNVPTKACLVNMDDDNTIITGDGAVGFNHFVSMTINPAINDVYSFDFYMPENIYDENSEVKSYQERDVWTKKPEMLLGKKWSNAPQTSTFVVISGTYSGNSTVDDNGTENSGDHAVTGDVQYTIHLGDFSDLTGNGNYSVARNVSYTYNVSVTGVNKIVVEALTDREDQPGAEGQIFTYDGSTYSYELDAHYEQLFLEYNLSSIASAVEQKLGSYNSNMKDAEIDNAIADNLILVIQSEAMDYTHNGSDYTVQNKRGTLQPYQIYADAVRSGENPANAKNSVWQGSGSGIQPTGGFDYQWIEFWPQESGTALAAYPGVSEWSRASTLTEEEENMVYGTAKGNTARLKDVYDVIVAMGKAVKNIYSGSVTTIITGDTPNDDGICIVKDGDNYVARFTAFVNEYYYYEHPLTHAKVTSWDVFVNKIPREMIIAMSSKISEDGNSSYSQVYSYITQRSMETFYNSRATAINGFGIETYNETPLTQVNFTFGTAKCTTSSGLSDKDGRSNQIALIGINQYNNQYNNWSYS